MATRFLRLQQMYSLFVTTREEQCYDRAAGVRGAGSDCAGPDGRAHLGLAPRQQQGVALPQRRDGLQLLNPQADQPAACPYRLEGFELASGLVTGTVAGVPRLEAGAVGPGAARPGAAVRQGLEEVLLEALRRPPVVIAFSGGRDSSGLLALAVELAGGGGEEPRPGRLAEVQLGRRARFGGPVCPTGPAPARAGVPHERPFPVALVRAGRGWHLGHRHRRGRTVRLVVEVVPGSSCYLVPAQ